MKTTWLQMLFLICYLYNFVKSLNSFGFISSFLKQEWNFTHTHTYLHTERPKLLLYGWAKMYRHYCWNLLISSWNLEEIMHTHTLTYTVKYRAYLNTSTGYLFVQVVEIYILVFLNMYLEYDCTSQF